MHRVTVLFFVVHPVLVYTVTHDLFLMRYLEIQIDHIYPEINKVLSFHFDGMSQIAYLFGMIFKTTL